MESLATLLLLLFVVLVFEQEKFNNNRIAAATVKRKKILRFIHILIKIYQEKYEAFFYYLIFFAKITINYNNDNSVELKPYILPINVAIASVFCFTCAALRLWLAPTKLY